ncbi:hypothetical protein EDB80DRAFT_870901 [Ilyonectria destructans]|nr:hypothetical protein EDB80DRAFT_870901 [Ilyonectria destructans]
MRVRPPTAGVGVLCIDGGGVRGIIPTTILELLEEEHFQLCAGAPSPSPPCSSTVGQQPSAARHSRPLPQQSSVVASWLDCPGISQLWTVVNNALYDSLPLEVTLKAIFDATTSMTAPSYFAPMHINGVGLLQDAGVIQNNPINLALSELRSLYPAKSLPQYLISLATGIERASRERVPGKRPGFFKRHFLYRLFRAYMSLLSGKKTMDDFDRSTKTSPVLGASASTPTSWAPQPPWTTRGRCRG